MKHNEAQPQTTTENTERAIDVLIAAVRDGVMKPNRTWATAMSALLRRKESNDGHP